MATKPNRAARRYRLGVVLAVIALGAAVRLLTAGQVFTPQGTRFIGDNDPLYHVLRAERILENYPAGPWRDPNLNYPLGARIPWPPLFDEIIAASAMVVGSGHPTNAQTEHAAAFVPLVIGVGTLPIVAALGTVLFEWETGLAAAIFLALLPAHVIFSAVGRPDQHVAELFVFSWILLAFAHGWRGEQRRGLAGWRAAIFLGVGIAVAFWTWQGSALHLLFPVLFAAVWHLLAPADDEIGRKISSTLFRGGLIGAGLLVISLALFGPRDGFASMSLSGISAVQPVIALLSGAFGAFLSRLERVIPSAGSRSRRIAHVLIAGLVPLVLALVILPGFRGGLAQGLLALGATNPWYARINEFRPIIDPARGIGDGLVALATSFGIGPLLMAITVPRLLAGWARQENRPATLFLALLSVLFVVLAAIRVRFGLYLCVPMALCAARFVQESRTPLSRRLPYITFASLALIIGAKAIWGKPVLPAAVSGDLLHTLEWLRDAPSPPHRRAVLFRWDSGHAIQYYALKPVLVSPFGTEDGEGAMEDAAAFYLSSIPSAAEDVLTRREVGVLILDNPLNEANNMFGFAPRDTPQAAKAIPNWLKGERLQPTEAFWRLLPARLYFFDGTLEQGSAPKMLSGYRLLYETPSTGGAKPIDEQRLKVFGIVPGASVVAAGQPNVMITASASVRTNQGRTFTWATTARADGSGHATLSLPYCTGRNGEVTAGPYLLTDGRTRRDLSISDAAVEGGEQIQVVLSSASNPASLSHDLR